MKRFTRGRGFRGILIISILLVFSVLSALKLDIDNPEDQPLFKCNESNGSFTEFTFTLSGMEVTEETVNGREYHHLWHNQAAYTIDEGMPELPMFGTMIAIPDNGTVSFEIVNQLYRDLNGFYIYPSQGVHLDGAPYEFQINKDFYGGKGSYEHQKVLVGEPAVMRDWRVVPVNVLPFEWDARTGNLRVITEITVRMHYSTEPGTNELDRGTRKYSRSFESLYAGTILNYEMVRDEEPDYQAPCVLVIHPNITDVNEQVDIYVDWKRTKGYHVIDASTTDTGTSSSSILNYIQNAYQSDEYPVEYVVLVGDMNGSIAIPSWIENFSTYQGEGDHPYTLLEGNDYLSDVFIGRISVSDVGDLMVYMTKMNIYEREVNIDFPQMYNHSLLVGDTSPSGFSCIVTNKYVKDQILMDDPDHTFTELYHDDPSPNEMNNALNQGALFFNYRGYLGMSNWDSSDIASLDNTNKLFNATIITCSTGSFSGTANTELVIRAGTPSAPKGGVSAIGMATSGTHTQFNNSLNGGIYHGIQSLGMRTMGEAHNNGQVEFYAAYWNCAQNYVKMFTHWFNQMGDPVLNIWVAEPLDMQVTYDTSIPKGQDFIEVNVTDMEGYPIQDAWVTARKFDESILATGFTNNIGSIVLPINGESTGNVNLTVTADDHIPHLGQFTVQTSGGLSYYTMAIDDDNAGDSQGNDNGNVEPGEIIELVTSLKNYSSNGYSQVQAELISNDPYIEILTANGAYGTISAGGTAEVVQPYVFSVSSDAPDMHQAEFLFNISDDSGNEWSDRLWIPIEGNDLDITGLQVIDGNNTMDPGDTVNLRFTIVNNGQTDLTDVWAELRSLNGLIGVNDSLAYFGNLNVGQSATCTTNDFEIYSMAQILPGMQIPLELNLYNNDGYAEEEIETLPIGNVTVNDPIGPDAYGYICYDSNDTDYVDAPEYEWIEINPSSGGEGTDTGLVSSSIEHGVIDFFDLPFTFSFYGQEYDNIGICTNGYITFGYPESENVSFRNWPIPGAMGTSPMIAGFWEDLLVTNSNKVYYWYDDESATPAFIIQYDNCQIATGSNVTFEIILYDPEFSATPQGDGLIKIQYQEFNNTDSINEYNGWQGNYCTVGIEDHTGTMGLQYTYDDEYPTGAMTLADNTAILFTGVPIIYPDSYLMLGDIVVHDENGSGVIDAGESVNLGVFLQNVGLTETAGAFAELSCYDPYVNVTADTAYYQSIESGQSASNTTFFSFETLPYTPDNHVINFEMNIENVDGEWDYFFTLVVRKPSVTLLSSMINDIDQNNNGVMDPGETAQLIINLTNDSASPAEDVVAVLSSDSEDITISNPQISYGTILPGHNKQQVFTITVSENAETPGSAEFNLNINFLHAEASNYTFPMGIGDWGFQESFESDNGGFYSYAGWQYGTPTMGAHSGEKCWATHIASDYGNHVSWYLNTERFFIGDNTWLTYWQYYDTELGYDGGNVKISNSNGIAWDLITPEGGYPTAQISSSTSGVGGEPGYTGNSNGWQQVSYDLSEYTGEEIILRWHFGSNGSNVAYGWAIDDVVVSGGQERSGIINGNVTLSEPYGNIEKTEVTVGSYTTFPNEEGDYTLYVPGGLYDLTATLPGYEIGLYEDVTIEAGEVFDDYDFAINWLCPATELACEVDEDTGDLTLTWEYDLPATTREKSRKYATTNREEFVQFNIYKQIESGYFEMVDSTTTQEFEDVIESSRIYRYYVTVLYDTGESLPTEIISIVHYNENENENIPKFVNNLENNYPNPFNPETNFAFSIAKPGKVSLKIYNVKGQLVKTLVNERMDQGRHMITWSGTADTGKPVSSGIYFYRLQTDKYTQTRKALLLK